MNNLSQSNDISDENQIHNCKVEFNLSPKVFSSLKFVEMIHSNYNKFLQDLMDYICEMIKSHISIEMIMTSPFIFDKTAMFKIKRKPLGDEFPNYNMRNCPREERLSMIRAEKVNNNRLKNNFAYVINDLKAFLSSIKRSLMSKRIILNYDIIETHEYSIVVSLIDLNQLAN